MEKGFIIPLIAIILVIAAGIGGYVMVRYQKVKKDTISVPLQNPYANTPLSPASTSTTSTQTIPAGWKTYRNEKWGFEFVYPEQWKITDDDDPAAPDAHSVFFENRADAAVSGATFYLKSQKPTGYEDSFKIWKKVVPDAQKLIIGGFPAIRYSTAKTSGGQIRTLVFLNEGRLVLFFVVRGQYVSNQQEYDTVMESFRLINR